MHFLLLSLSPPTNVLVEHSMSEYIMLTLRTRQITLWESDAILQYLVATYDKSNSISFPAGSKAFHLTNQWLFFQASGQGPYYGQSAWFQRYHPEKLPSAIARYQKEVARVVSVIDLHLSKTGQQYLVADDGHKEGKATIADVAFVPWGLPAQYLTDEDLFEGGKNQKYKEWMDRLTALPYVADTLKEKDEASKTSAH